MDAKATVFTHDEELYRFCASDSHKCHALALARSKEGLEFI